MTRRILPREDWDRLVGWDLAQLAAHLPPDACVLVVEDEHGEIIAVTSAFSMVHLEGTQIAAAHQGKAAAARRLLEGIAHLGKRMGVRRMVTASINEPVAAFLERMGAERLPGEHWVLPMREERRCQSEL